MGGFDGLMGLDSVLRLGWRRIRGFWMGNRWSHIGRHGDEGDGCWCKKIYGCFEEELIARCPFEVGSIGGI